MNELSMLDFLIMITVLLGMWRGFKVGLIQSVVSLIGWIIAFFVGTHFASDIAPFFSGIVDSNVLQVAMGFLTVVLIMIAIIHVVASTLKTIMNTLNLGFLDKMAGGILGAIRSILIVLVILSMSAPMLVKLPMWQTSQLAPELLPYAPVAKKLVKEVVGDAWEKFNLKADPLTEDESKNSELAD